MTTTTAQPHPCSAGCPVHQGSHKPVQALHQIAEPTIILTEQDAILLVQASEMLEDYSAEQRQRGNCSTAEGAECSAHAVQRLGVAMLAAQRDAQSAPAAQTLVRYCPECGHVGEVGKDHHDCCPDGSAAFMVPEKYAQDLRAGFKALLPSRRTAPAFEQRLSDWQYEDAAQLNAARQAVRDYHYALDTRQHGGTAGDKALDAIQGALGMHWEQGAEATRRAASAAQGEA